MGNKEIDDASIAEATDAHPTHRGQFLSQPNWDTLLRVEAVCQRTSGGP